MARRTLLRLRMGVLIGGILLVGVLLVTAVAATLTAGPSLTVAVVAAGRAPLPGGASSTPVDGLGLVLVSAVSLVFLEQARYALGGDDGTATLDARTSGDDALAVRARRIAHQADLPDPNVRVVDSPRPNSVATGSPPTVYVTSGLVDRLSGAELDAVIAHELAHVKHWDGTVTGAAAGAAYVAAGWLRSAARSLVAGLVAVLALSVLAVPVAWIAAGPVIRDIPGVVAALAIYRGLLVVAVGACLASAAAVLVLAPVYGLAVASARRFARLREYAADEAAAAILGRPAPLASALERLSSAERKPGRDARALPGGIQSPRLLSGPLEWDSSAGTTRLSATTGGDECDDARQRAAPGVTDLALRDAHPPIDERIRRLRALET